MQLFPMRNRILSLIFAAGCFTMAAALQRRPAPRRTVVPPSSAMLLRPSSLAANEAALQRHVPARHYDHVKFEAIIADLSAAAGIPVEIDRTHVLKAYPLESIDPLSMTTPEGTLQNAIIYVIDKLEVSPLYLAVSEGKIIITLAENVPHDTVECFNVHKLLTKLAQAAPWTLLPSNENARPIEALPSAITSTVCVGTWDQGASLQRVGDVLVVLQSARNQVLIHQFLSEIEAVIDGRTLPPRSFIESTEPGRKLPGIIDIRPVMLAAEVSLPGPQPSKSSRDAALLDDIRALAQFGMYPTHGGEPPRNTNGLVTCGPLFLLETTPKGRHNLDILFDAVEKAAMKEGCRVDVALPVLVSGEPSDLRIACFNVGRLLRAYAGEKKRRPIDDLQVALTESVPQAVWNGPNGGDIYTTGCVMTVVQRPEILDRIEAALKELPRH